MVYIDEPCPESIYTACISRLRMGGLMIITATPLTGSAWMYDKIICGHGDKKNLRAYREADVWSACGDIEGTRGFLSRENIERMINEYSEDEQQARILGKFQHLTGLVFKKFSRKVHVIKPFEITKDYTVYEYLDPHRRTSDAVAWYAIDKYGRKFVVDEYFREGTIEDLSIEIKKRRELYRVESAFIDPWAFQEDQHTGKSLATMLADHGLNYLPATKARATADRAIQDALDYVSVDDSILKEPEIFFFQNCLRHIYEMEHYRWDEWSGKTADKKGKKEKPVDKDDHMVENLGRFLLQGHKYVDYVGSVEQQPETPIEINGLDSY